MNWNTLPSDEIVEATKQAIEKNGIQVIVVDTAAEAKEAALKLIPKQSQVMTMTSATLDETGIAEAINISGDYDAAKPKLYAMDRATQGKEMQQLGASPEYAIGSMNALTQDGKLFWASMTGSQLSAYAYGSAHTIWVVSTQKIVPTMEDALKRIYEYVLPLESERAKKAYGVPGSSVNKLLMIEREINPGRSTVILVKEKLGF